MLAHLLPLGSGSVAGSDGRSNGRKRNALAGGKLRNLGQRNFQVLVNVVAQGLARLNKHDFGLIGEFSGPGGTHQAIKTDEKSGQRLAGAGWGGDEDVVAFANRGPAQNLRLGGSTKPGAEPFGDQGIEIRQ
jgi:hypothetical protein